MNLIVNQLGWRKMSLLELTFPLPRHHRPMTCFSVLQLKWGASSSLLCMDASSGQRLLLLSFGNCCFAYLHISTYTRCLGTKFKVTLLVSLANNLIKEILNYWINILIHLWISNMYTAIPVSIASWIESIKWTIWDVRWGDIQINWIAGFCSTAQERITNTAAYCPDRNCPSKERVKKTKWQAINLLYLPIIPQIHIESNSGRHLLINNSMFSDNRGRWTAEKKTNFYF